MKRKIDIQELSIVIVAKGLNPTVLNPDFLKYSGIIPAEWELTNPPILSPQVTQLVFQSGVSLVAQPGIITFTESLTDKPIDEVKIPTFVCRYIKTMPNIDYQAIGINPRRIVAFDEQDHQTDSAHRYITKALLAAGPWQQVDNAPVHASINLIYEFDRCRFGLNIAEIRLQMQEKDSIPAVLFAGNFNYNIANEKEVASTEQLNQAIANWKPDLETYLDLLETKFLSQSQADPVFAMQSVI
jgi:hypothetical protein